MKKVIIYFSLSAILIFGCKKDKISNTPTPPPKGQLEIKIQVPANTDLEVNGGEVLSGATFVDIKDKNKVPIPVFKDDITPVYVFDNKDNLVMMGFAGDNARIVSSATTAQVLLYWGLGLPYADVAFTKSFFEQYEGNKIVGQWVQKFEQDFIADPLIISKGGFIDGLTATVKELRNKDVLDANNMKKSADIKVDAANVKSGLRVQEDGLSQYSVNNYYRRRAHAYLYKMNYTDMNNSKHTLISQFGENTKAENDFPVSSRSGVTSVMGEIGKWVDGSDMGSMVAKTDPNQLQLEDNESEALYKLRIVGPGSLAGAHMSGNEATTAELSKYLELSAETFLLDFLIPTLSLITSAEGMTADFDWSKKDIDIAIDAIKSFWKTTPDVYEEIKKGSYSNALKKVITSIGADVANTYLTAIFDGIGDMGLKNLWSGSVTHIKISKVLAVVDFILGTTDLALTTNNILSSKGIESFDITARTGKVTLLPVEATGVSGSFIKLEAIIKNMELPQGTHPFFEWSTSGNFGELWDNQGHRSVSFESQDAKPQYYVKASSNQLSDGNNFEYVYVKAYIGSNVVGTDTTKINVKKVSYKILPTGVTISGQKDKANEIRLYLVRSDNKKDIGQAGDYDYKVVWDTAGSHGKLKSGFNNSTTITTYNSDNITYSCTDEDTKEAQEEIRAKVYMKQKTAPDDEYFLASDTKGIVKISNDENKKIIHIPMTVFIYQFPDQDNWCGQYPMAIFPVEDSAKHYQVVFYNFPPNYILDGRIIEKITYSWAKGQRPNNEYNPFHGENPPLVHNGQYYISFAWTGGNCDWINTLPSDNGGVMVEVTYYY